MSFQQGLRSFDEWEKQVPDVIKADAVWKMEVYRLALFMSDLAWFDVTKLMKDKRTQGLADQLYRYVGSISANVEEDFSRSSGKDRARFYEYALGSTRESRGWYYKDRHILTDTVVAHRLDLCASIIKLLLTLIPAQRITKPTRPTKHLSEESPPYGDK
jgi:four helix bundle protein